ncbi:hypothetical protein WP4S18C04_18880 [Klebsiella pneumoniae]|nr:DUF551 domain-containing protein [Klebsiella pneumoniae]KDL56778.1 hypothetical protein AF52_01131 [Klebsiella pneumoniae MGH 66]BBR77302.1 hypothetical protein WP4S18C04_18880 [Klebsiella pneumoniae]
MTKSTITRERIELIANFHRAMTLPPSHDEIEELARIALAAMYSEPVAYISKSDFDAGYPHILARRDFNKACTMPVYAAQPVPVVPKSISVRQAISALESAGAVTTIGQAYKMGWNACRAAMLQELKKSAGAEAICRSDENVQLLHTKSPAQSDCCPAQNVVAPAQSPIDHGYLPECECAGCKATARICTEMAVNSLVIPDEMTSGQAYEIGYYYGDPVDVFARGANWMRQHIIDSTLAAAPQLPGSDPATVPGKWIPVNERMPEAEGHYLVWANASRIDGYCDHLAIATYQGGEWSNEFNWLVNHWMPLPAAPQEGKWL